METNIAEVTDVMQDRMIHSVIIFCFSFLGIYKSVNELKSLNIPVKWSVLFLSLYLFVGYPLFVFLKIKKANFSLLYTGSPIRTCQMLITERFPLIYGQISSIILYFHEKKEVKKYLLQDRVLPAGVFWNNPEWAPEKIFFVLGESQCSQHLSLYGYDIKTTPFLDSLYQASSKMTVYNAISPACNTLDGTRLLFTFATPMDQKPLFMHKNIIELANDAGYQTVWLSNQTTFDIWGNIISQISSLSHDIYFTGYEETTRKLMDISLIPVLQKKYQKNRKQFFLIHLQGSHYNYKNKYDQIDEAAIEEGNNKNVHYDRSIHHTDRVLREIYRIMKADTSAILYYISDHGQDLEMGGHSLINGSILQFDVPMFIINQTKIDVNSVVDKYFLHDKNRINTLSTINILSELMGYSFSDEIILEVREQSNYVYHVDGRTYKWDELE